LGADSVAAGIGIGEVAAMRVETPIGPLPIAVTEAGLARISFAGKDKAAVAAGNQSETRVAD
jgi:hypothetical protein